MGAKQPDEGPDIPPADVKTRMLQDWCSLHNHVLRRALAFAVLSTDNKLDAYNQHILLRVKYRPDCGGNSAKAFALENGIVEDDPASDTPEGRNLESFKATAKAKTEAQRGEDPDMMAWIRLMSAYTVKFAVCCSLRHDEKSCSSTRRL